jgi:hypothetical protein
MIKGASSHQMPWADSKIDQLPCVPGLREWSQLAFASKEEGTRWE